MRALIFAPLLLLVSSCTFPDVQFGDASLPVDSGSDVVVANDASTDDGGDASDPCDMDHDGYKAMGSCGGNDCNDNDPRANPGVTQPVYAQPDAAPFGDWNCDGTVVFVYPFTACGLNACNVQTFATSTGCGITNPFVTCTGALCAAADAGTRTQGCL
jgi:hypothetical protein